jgi:lipoprotein-releasing system permease protein
LNYELYIAKKILFSKTDEGPKHGAISARPVIKIAITGVVLGLAVMIIALAVVTGFKKEIRDKITGFGGHIVISNYDDNSSYEVVPIDVNPEIYRTKDKIKGIRRVQEFATKAGIIKTDDQMEGVVLKGVGPDFDWEFFRNKISAGKLFKVDADSGTALNEVMISRQTADRLKLKTGDKLFMYFIQQPPRSRKFTISGIYQTGLEDFDKLFVLCDIRHIRKLNDWTARQTGGYEILIDDFDKLDEISQQVYSNTGYNLNTKTIRDKYPQIFDWLELQNINVVIIIVLMLLVSGINMISALLIIILERTRMIGILKSLGAGNYSIRKIFLYTAAYLSGAGIIIGNILGIGLCLLQQKYGLISLSEESYYVSKVPINLSLIHLLLLNAGTFACCILMMILPSFIITRISPVKAMKFD